MYYFMLSLTIDLLPSILLLVPFLILWQVKCCKNMSIARNILLLLFTVYIMAVFHVTGLPTVGTFSPQFNINLVPTITLRSYPVHYVLNIFMFVPFGLLLPLLWNGFSKFRYVLPAGFGFSCLIELLQLLTFRVTDVDDLITNTLGTITGFLLARLCIHMHWFSMPKSKNSYGANIKELSILLGMGLFVWIFITPFITNFIWSYLF